jgi:hypothetical protein
MNFRRNKTPRLFGSSFNLELHDNDLSNIISWYDELNSLTQQTFSKSETNTILKLKVMLLVLQEQDLGDLKFD